MADDTRQYRRRHPSGGAYGIMPLALRTLENGEHRLAIGWRPSALNTPPHRWMAPKSQRLKCAFVIDPGSIRNGEGVMPDGEIGMMPVLRECGMAWAFWPGRPALRPFLTAPGQRLVPAYALVRSFGLAKDLLRTKHGWIAADAALLRVVVTPVCADENALAREIVQTYGIHATTVPYVKSIVPEDDGVAPDPLWCDTFEEYIADAEYAAYCRQRRASASV